MSELEQISEGGLNFLSFAANHEIKLLTLLLMKEGREYDRSQFSMRLREVLGPGHRIEPGHLMDFCQDSLDPGGMVYADNGNYLLTPFGLDIAIPSSPYFIDFSLRHRIPPLSRLLGQTSSPRKAVEPKRAPVTRLKIFSALLAADGPITQKQLIEATGEQRSTIASHVATLSKFGIIEKDSIKADSPFTIFSISPEDPEDFETGSNYLIDRCYSLFVTHPELKATISDVIDLLLQKYQDMDYLGRHSLFVHTGEALSTLIGYRCLVRGRFNEGHQSDISLSQDQRIILSDLMAIVNRLWREDVDFLAEGRQRAVEMLSDRVTLKELIDHRVRSRFKDTKKQVFSLIREYQGPKGITSEEIRLLLKAEYERDVTIATVRDNLRALQDDKKIRHPKRGQANNWFIT